MNIVLYEPQIPPNTGNIARLCAATKCHLILLGKLGFDLTDKQLKLLKDRRTPAQIKYAKKGFKLKF